MTEQLPNCPECGSAYAYEDRGLFICPECGHEWSPTEEVAEEGASGAIKQGTKVKNIRLVEGDHNIDCKVDGFGPMKLKSEFVKKN